MLVLDTPASSYEFYVLGTLVPVQAFLLRFYLTHHLRYISNMTTHDLSWHIPPFISRSFHVPFPSFSLFPLFSPSPCFLLFISPIYYLGIPLNLAQLEEHSSFCVVVGSSLTNGELNLIYYLYVRCHLSSIHPC